MTHNPGEYELDIIGIFNRSADIGQHCLSGIFGSDWSVVALRGQMMLNWAFHLCPWQHANDS